MQKSLLFFFLLAISSAVFSQDFSAVKQLASRRVPWLSDKLVFKQISTDNGKDMFELSSLVNKIVIGASNTNAAAMGLNWYLKYYCHRSMSHLGDNLSPVKNIPHIKDAVKIVSPYSVRYALNYCTLNYTMSFYTWEDWERELDWMALNGFNVMLMPVGIESVWQKTLLQCGFDQNEVDAFIPGPAFQAWWLMGNLEGWGGPMSQIMIDGQAQLAKKIVRRMKALGIEPVLQGFYGMVPTILKKKYPSAKIMIQGKWSGGFTRPDVLPPQDSLFKKMAGIYYSELKKLYGADIHYFGGDLFHEGGSSRGIDIPQTASLIQHTLDKYFPDATWVLQAWGSNPSDELLKGLDKQHVLIVELLGEHATGWDSRKGFGGTPFVLCPVGNFGEKVGIFGRLEYFADEINKAENSPYSNLMKGIGIMPEGIDNNPVLYDMIAEAGWRSKKINIDNWINNYIQYRYGAINEHLKDAWKLLLRTAYDSVKASPDGPPESVFCARPGTTMQIASVYGTLKRTYDTSLFHNAVTQFVAAEKESPSLKYAETYQTDKVDFLRQVNANNGLSFFQNILDAINDKNLAAFKKSYAVFRDALLQQDALLQTNKYFRLSRWIKQAEQFGTNKADKALAVRDAKEQISYWGPDNNPKTDLHDYANKEWSGMLSSLYLQRWDAFYRYELNLLEHKPASEPDYYSMETNWAASLRKDGQ